jgi:hypothetical protein
MNNVIDLKNHIRNISAAEYHALDRASWHRLSNVRQSPAHCLQSMLETRKQTAAQLAGTLVHTLVLEPQQFEAQYVVHGPLGRSKADIELKEKLTSQLKKGQSLIDEETVLEMQPVANAVLSHSKAGALLAECDQREISIVWTDNETKVECKSRIDAYSSSLKALVDLKTTTDASPESFSKDVANYRYHQQLAFYRRALKHVGLEVEYAMLIAVEKKAPYGVMVYRVAVGDLAKMDEENTSLLSEYGQCSVAGVWPNYEEKIIELALPNWAF